MIAISAGVTLTGIALAPVAMQVQDNPERKNYVEQFEKVELLSAVRSREKFVSQQLAQTNPSLGIPPKLSEYSRPEVITPLAPYYRGILAQEKRRLSELEVSLATPEVRKAYEYSGSLRQFIDEVLPFASGGITLFGLLDMAVIGISASRYRKKQVQKDDHAESKSYLKIIK